MRTPLVLAAGSALVAIALILTLSRSPARIAGTNSIPADTTVASVADGNANACQAGGTLPAATNAVRLSLFAVIGPRVTVQVLAGKRLLAHGSLSSGWTGQAVTVPVNRAPTAVPDVRVCFILGPAQGNIMMLGEKTRPALAATSGGTPLRGVMRIDYMRAGNSSWWARASGVAHRMSLGRAWSGEWIVFLVILIVTAIGASCGWLVLQELR